MGRSAMPSIFLFAAIVCLFSFSYPSAVEGIQCEDIPAEFCSFAVASMGTRCILEMNIGPDGTTLYECQTSPVIAERTGEWIESEECVRECGLARMTVGISSDSLVEKDLTKKLCSPNCRHGCPNIFDLYARLAEGEGVTLPAICEAHGSNSRTLLDGASFASLSQATGESLYADAPMSY